MQAHAERAALFAAARAELSVLVESLAGAMPAAFHALLAKYEHAPPVHEDAASAAERRLYAAMRTVRLHFDATTARESCPFCETSLGRLAPEHVVRLAATPRHHAACALVRAGCCLPCAPLLLVSASGATLCCPLCRAAVRVDEVLRGCADSASR